MDSLLDTVAGLPVHPLVVHAAVVLLPLAALGAILMAVWRSFSRRFGVIVVITAGVGGALRVGMLKAAQPVCLRIQGPNCLGLLLPHVGLNASFSNGSPRKGDLAFLSQSGALITAIVDWASTRGIGSPRTWAASS